MTCCSKKEADVIDAIAPVDLTNEQNEIAFTFKTKEMYKSVVFWVETYQKGNLVDTTVALNHVTDEAETYDGQITISNFGSDSDWTFKLEDNSGYVNNPVTIPYKIIVDTVVARVYKPINEPVAIDNNKEIILVTKIFVPQGSGGGISGDQQDYLRHPELIKTYPYVQFIKCKFTK